MFYGGKDKDIVEKMKLIEKINVAEATIKNVLETKENNGNRGRNG